MTGQPHDDELVTLGSPAERAPGFRSGSEQPHRGQRDPDRVELSFAFVGYGWAVLRVQDRPRGRQLHQFTFSHITDGIGQLVEAAAGLCGGQGDEFSVLWDQEPEKVRVVVARDEPEGSMATMTFSSEGADPARAPEVTSVVRVRLSVEALREAVRRAVDEIDPAEYAESWPLHPFPQAARRSLGGGAPG